MRGWPGQATTGWAWPKAGLESCARYLARDLGEKKVRVNLVAAGPLRTWRQSIPGSSGSRGMGQPARWLDISVLSRPLGCVA